MIRNKRKIKMKNHLSLRIIKFNKMNKIKWKSNNNSKNQHKINNRSKITRISVQKAKRALNKKIK